MRNKTFSNEQLQSDRIVPITNSCEWQKHPLYQIFRILLPIFPSLARLRGGAGHPDWVESARRRGQPRSVPLTASPGREPPGFLVLRGVRFHVPLSLILSPCHADNKYRLIFGVNCFLFLTKLPPVCGGEGRGEPAGPTPPASAPLPPSLLTEPATVQILSVLSAPGQLPAHQSLAHRRLTPPILLHSRHPQRMRTRGPEEWRGSEPRG